MAPGSFVLWIFDEVSLSLTDFVPISLFLAFWQTTREQRGITHLIGVQAVLTSHSLVGPPQLQGPSWASIQMEADILHTAAMCPAHRLPVPLALPPPSRFPAYTDLQIYPNLKFVRVRNIRFLKCHCQKFLSSYFWIFELCTHSGNAFPSSTQLFL